MKKSIFDKKMTDPKFKSIYDKIKKQNEPYRFENGKLYIDKNKIEPYFFENGKPYKEV